MHIAIYVITGVVVGLACRGLWPDSTAVTWLSAAVGGLGALIAGVVGDFAWKTRRPVRFHWIGVSLALVGAALASLIWQRSQFSAPPETAQPESVQTRVERSLAELRSPLLPSGAQPEAVLVLQKNEQGEMAPVLLGSLRTVPVEQGGETVAKPDPLVPGNIVIVRDLDDEVAKTLKVTNGTLQVAGAYISRDNHELEYLGQVDLNKRNKRLAVEFGLGTDPPKP